MKKANKSFETARVAWWSSQRRTRRATILIFVVALLVLMALIGTAFIASTGNDRVSSARNREQTQADVALDGVLDAAAQSLASQTTPLVDPATGKIASVNTSNNQPTAAITSFRPPVPTSLQGALDAATANDSPLLYPNVDYTPWSTQLADRYPYPIGPTNPDGTPSGPVTGVFWKYISGNPLVGLTSPVAAGVTATVSDFTPGQFNSPYASSLANYQISYGTRAGMEPTFITIRTLDGRSRDYPAFIIHNSRSGEDGKLVMAMDADGDGIADSGMIELPIAETNGIHWYYGIRVIDNSAAINASVAWESTDYYTDTLSIQRKSDLPTNISPVNIDLRLLACGVTGAAGTDGTFTAPTGMNALNYERFGRQGTLTAPVISLNPTREDGTASPGRTTDPTFRFVTEHQAFWSQLGSRLDNPGWWSNSNTVTNEVPRYRPLGMSESAALAHKFCINSPSGSSSILETSLPNGMGMSSTAAANTAQAAIYRATGRPYLASQAFDTFVATSPNNGTVTNGLHRSWFHQIFDYDNLASNRTPLRPLLTGHNSVSNTVPSFYVMPAGGATDRNGLYLYRNILTSAPPYSVGDWIQFNGRAYICIRNQSATTALAPPVLATDPGWAGWTPAPWFNTPVKINVNTADFGQLFAAYQMIMADGPTAVPSGAAPDPDNTLSGAEQANRFTFGNVLRPTSAFRTLSANTQATAYYMKQLRAALAAVNTIDLRDQDHDVTSRRIALTNPDGSIAYYADVFGTECQPYITEVMVDFSVDKPPYVAMELFNPYPFPLDLKAFRFAWRERLGGFGPLTAIGAADGGDNAGTVPTIAAYGYVHYENDPSLRPTKNYTVPAAIMRMQKLGDVLAAGGTREMYMLRTRRYNGLITASNNPTVNPINEAAPGATSGLEGLVPADQMEFIGILQQQITSDPTTIIPAPTRYHYRRANRRGTSDLPTNRWHCVYSGPYNSTPAAQERRQRGWVAEYPRTQPDIAMFNPGDAGFSIDKDQCLVGAPKPQNTADGSTYSTSHATYRTRCLQVNNFGMPGPWMPPATAADSTYFRLPNNGVPGSRTITGVSTSVPPYPAGGFLRNGDILQVPYVGGYTIWLPSVDASLNPTAMVEMNSITMDSVFAEDGDFADDEDPTQAGKSRPMEQLGRFCPLVADPAVDLILNPATNRYHWAVDLFDFLTVMSPQDDYLLNVDPSRYTNTDTATWDTTVTAATQMRKWPASLSAAATLANIPMPVSNTPGYQYNQANGGREDSASIQGLINVNTANWKVLSTVPFTKDPVHNRNIARAIVQYRDYKDGNPAAGPGRPYRTLFDLMRVPQFRTMDGLMVPGNFNPDVADGDLSPLPIQWKSIAAEAATSDNIFGDFEARFLPLTRVSNMLTTRSDSFTVYVVVQGWRNANTSAPELVVERRGARIIDRSSVRPMSAPSIGTLTPQLTPPNIVPVPQD